MSHNPSNPVSAYLASIASKGGRSGRGDAKRRPDSHYAALAKAARLKAKMRRDKIASSK